MFNKRTILLFLTLSLLLITPTLAAADYTWNPDTNTATVYKNANKWINVTSLNVVVDVDEFRETLSITSNFKYDFIKNTDFDLKSKKHSGKYGITSAEYYLHTITSYEVIVLDYGLSKNNVTGYGEFEVIGNHTETRYKNELILYNPDDKKIDAGQTLIFDLVVRKPSDYGTFSYLLKPVFMGNEIKELTWWNSSFSSKDPITITTTGNSTPAWYQVKANVTYKAEMQADFDDIRFLNNTEDTELPYWIESKVNGSYANVWINLSDAITDPGSDIVWMYYGNADISAGSDIGNTFVFGDDFNRADGTDLGADWSEYGDGLYAISGGTLYRPDAESGNYQLALVNLSGSLLSVTDIIVESKINVTAVGSTSEIGLCARDNGLLPIGGTARGYELVVSEAVTSTRIGDKNLAWADTQVSTQALNEWWNWKFLVEGNNQRGSVWKVGTAEPSTWIVNAARTTQISGYIGLSTAGTTGSEIAYYDDFRVRKYIANEPTYSIGTAQYYTDSLHYNATANYNHTIESDGTITANRSIVTEDDTNWTASSTGITYWTFDTEVIPDGDTNFTLSGSALNNFTATNLTPILVYAVINESIVGTFNTNDGGVGSFETDLVAGSYTINYYFDDSNRFNSTWDTSKAGVSGATSIRLPLEATGTYKFIVEWGDGDSDIITAYDQAEVTHNYSTGGIYDVSIYGDITGFSFNNGGDKLKITNISKWGDLMIGNSTGYFYGCANLDVSATDALNLSGTTTLKNAFRGDTTLSSIDTGAWDTSTVTDFSTTFFGCTGLTTLNITGWDTSKATRFYGTFYGDTGLTTLDTSGWDTSNVTTFYAVFANNHALTAINTSGWDTSKVTSFEGAFVSCNALTELDVSGWDTANVTTFRQTFDYDSGITSLDTSGWNTSKVTSFYGAFHNTGLTSIDASNWNISSLTDAAWMFDGVTLSTSSYDALLIGWGSQTPYIQSTVALYAGGNTRYSPVAIYAHDNILKGTHGWTIYDDGMTPVTYFDSTWNTTMGGVSNATTIKLPLVLNGIYNFTVLWGDGNHDVITAYDQANVSHTYDSEGEYLVSIYRDITGFRFNNGGDKLKIIDISNWGPLNVGNSNGYFSGCANLNVSATDALNLSGTTTLKNMFNGATSLNSNFNNWNVSQVTTTETMFNGATNFNGDISGWNTGNVTTMRGMFYNADSFNNDIGGWDTSSLTDVLSMFYHAHAFNQNISAWDTSKVTTMNSMFSYANSFNQDLGVWDTSSVISMRAMFNYATSFNGNISGWNTGNVADMSYMFYIDVAFNQDIGVWNISKVTTMSDMFYGVTLSTTNYNALLNGWAGQVPYIQSSVIFSGGDSKYSCVAYNARSNTLIGNYSWAITDGGLNETFGDCVPPSAVTLLTPTNGSGSNVNQTAFDWTNATDAYRYQLLIANNSDFATGNIVWDIINIELSNYTLTVGQALTDGEYWWSVRANNTYGVMGNWSENGNYSFIIETISPIITDLNYSNVTASTSIITWNTDETANNRVCYGIEEGSVNNWTGCTYSGWNNGTSSISIGLSGLTFNTIYFYKPYSVDLYGNVNDSVSALNFTTGPEEQPINSVPLPIFLMLSFIFVGAFVGTITIESVGGLIFGLFATMIGAALTKISINGQLIEIYGHVGTEDIIVMGWNVIQIGALSWIFAFIALIAFGLTVKGTIEVVNYHLKPELEADL